MSEADILAMTYEDTCWVYRPCREKLPTGETVFKSDIEGRLVYEDIPCALSSPSGGRFNQTPSTALIPTDYSLFVRPEIDIEPGDTIVILRLGKETVAQAGQPERHKSHSKIPLVLSEDTA